ncbi:hypothetical protein F1360_004425 [Escherichia coli]
MTDSGAEKQSVIVGGILACMIRDLTTSRGLNKKAAKRCHYNKAAICHGRAIQRLRSLLAFLPIVKWQRVAGVRLP